MKLKDLAGLFRRRQVMTAILYSVGALIMLLLQSAPHGLPSPWGARPNLLVLYVTCVAVLEGGRTGMIIGTVAGILWGVFSFRLFGLDALILMLIGLAAGLLVEWVMRANWLTALMLSSAAVLIQSLLEWLFCYVIFRRENLAELLYRVYLPNAVYSVLLIPAVYWLVFLVARLLRRRERA